MGERTERKRGTIKREHGCSLCADDAVFFFNTREDLEKGASCLYAHLLKFGLTMHIGIGATTSKTEALFFPPPRRSYSEANTSRLDVLDGTGEFYWLHRFYDGIVHHSLTSDADIDKRIRPASATFGALKNIMTNKDIDLKSKEASM
jgi:hypothetical protein